MDLQTLNINIEKDNISALLLNINNNIPSERLLEEASNFLEIANRSGNIRNRARFIFSSLLERIESEKGKSEKINYLKSIFGEKLSHVYSWTQVFNYLKDKPDDIIEYYLTSERTGTTIIQYLQSVDKKLVHLNIKPFSNEDIKTIISTIDNNNFNIDTAKNFINKNYLQNKLSILTFEDDNEECVDSSKIDKLNSLLTRSKNTSFKITINNEDFELLNVLLEKTASKCNINLDINDPNSVGKTLMCYMLEVISKGMD